MAKVLSNFHYASGHLKASFFSTLVGVLGLTVLLAFLVHERNQAALQDRTKAAALIAKQNIIDSFERYEYGLNSTRSALILQGLDQINRDSFETYVASRDFISEFPGSRGFGFIKRVTRSEEATFVQQAQLDGAPDFAVRTLTPHTNERFIIQYIYPLEINGGATGLDIGSESNRRAAAIAAAQSGQPTLTAPITLVQAEGKVRMGFLALLPIYDRSTLLNSAQNKFEDTVGWSYTPLVVDEVLEGLNNRLKHVKVTVTDDAESQPFIVLNENSTETFNNNPIKFEQTIEFMGRQWHLETQPLPSMYAALNLFSPLWVVFCGIALSLLGTLIFILWLNRDQALAANVEKPVHEVTLLAFIKDPAFKKASLAYVGLLIIFMALSVYFYLQQEIRIAKNHLDDHLAQAELIVSSAHADYINDINFIKSSRPISSLLSMKSIYDWTKTDQISPVWEQQLADIFSAYMAAKPAVYQVRLIHADKAGKEIVRVERRQQLIETVNPDQLQEKGNRPYVQQTITFAGNNVLVSDIEPNIENGEVETPLRPTIRYSALVKDTNGDPAFIVVINTNPNTMIESLVHDNAKHHKTYVLNNAGDFVSHPDENRRFSTYFNQQFNWQSEFQRISAPLGFSASGLTTWASDSQKAAADEITLTPNNASTVGQIRIVTTTKVSQIYAQIFSLMASLFVKVLLVSLVVGFLFYLSWLNRQKSLKASQLSQELERERHKQIMFESITELSPEAMIITDSRGDIVLVNSKAELLFGRARINLIGRNVSIFIPQKFKAVHSQHIEQYAKDPSNRAMGDGKTLFGLHANNTEFPIEVAISPITVDGKTLFAAVIRDITERLKEEKTLKTATDNAEKANNAKSSFLANMSHEIRTPLNAVIGLAYILIDNELTPRQLDLVRKIQLAGRSILGIVNNVLDLSKIEANEMSVDETQVDIKELIEEVQAVFSNQASVKGLEFNVDIAPSFPKLVKTDDTLLRQILTNLIGNAIKFTDKGKVELIVKCQNSISASAKEVTAQIMVADTGVGIPDDVQEHIFQPFSQAEASTTRQYGGTGLGLSIVTRLVKLLNGNIQLNSQYGQGSRFTVTLPFEAITFDNLKSTDTVDALNVWIVDDDLLHLDHLATSLGWRTTIMTGGPHLIAKAKSAHDTQSKMPDVIMIDWQMPTMDGLATLDELSTLLGHEKMPAVLVVSQYEKDKIAKLDTRQLVNHILQKPIQGPELFNTVNDVVVNHTGNKGRVLASTRTESIEANWLPDIQVLVVDDSDINLEIVSAMLRSNGAIVLAENSAQNALDTLEKYPHKFDVVLMDIQMPVMDGLEATRRIRKDARWQTLPIIALTAGALTQEKELALTAGMNDFLTKPIEPALLISTLRQVVEKQRGSSVLIEGNSEVDNASTYPDWPNIPTLNNTAAVFQGDVALLASSIRRVMAENENLIQYADGDTQALIQQTSYTALAAQVHKLRGTAGTIGAQALYEAAANSETALRNNDDATSLMVDVAQQLMALKENTKAFLASQEALPPETQADDSVQKATLSSDQSRRLKEALDSNDLAAIELAASFENELKATLGEPSYTELNKCLLNLNFEQALQILNNSTSNE